MKDRIKLKDNEIYKYDSIEGFSLYDPFEFKFNGFDIKSLYQHYLDKKNILEKNKIYFDKLRKHLKEFGHETSEDTLYKLIDYLIDNIKIFKVNNDYHYVRLDKDNYIIDYGLINGDIIDYEALDIPKDITVGYYKLEGGEVIKDKIKEALLWNF